MVYSGMAGCVMSFCMTLLNTAQHSMMWLDTAQHSMTLLDTAQHASLLAGVCVVSHVQVMQAWLLHAAYLAEGCQQSWCYCFCGRG